VRDAYLQRRLYLVHDGNPPSSSWTTRWRFRGSGGDARGPAAGSVAGLTEEQGLEVRNSRDCAQLGGRRSKVSEPPRSADAASHSTSTARPALSAAVTPPRSTVHRPPFGSSASPARRASAAVAKPSSRRARNRSGPSASMLNSAKLNQIRSRFLGRRRRRCRCRARGRARVLGLEALDEVLEPLLVHFRAEVVAEVPCVGDALDGHVQTFHPPGVLRRLKFTGTTFPSRITSVRTVAVLAAGSPRNGRSSAGRA